MRRALTSLVGAAGLAMAIACPAGAAVQVSQSGWQWGNPAPQGNTIRAIGSLSGRAYAVGDAGTALRTDDGGATWRGLNTGTPFDLDHLQLVTPDVLVVTGGNGCVVRRSDDGGATFRRLYVPTEQGCPNPVAAAYFVTPQVGYLMLRDGSVLRTADAGQTFSKQTAIPGTPASTGGGQASPADIVFTSTDRGLAFVTASGGGTLLYVTTDQGVSWKPLDLPSSRVRQVEMLDASNGYAVGSDTLLRTTDGGATWAQRPAGSGRDLTSIRCSDPQTCLLTLSAGDRLLRTTDAGATASEVTPATQAIDAAAFVSPSRVVAAGAGGATVVSDDGGVNYQPIGGDIGGSYPNGLRAGAGPATAFALGEGGQMARTTDGGATWKVVSVPTSASIADTSFASDTTGYALDDRGGLFKTTNAGQSWQTLDPGTTAAPSAVVVVGDTVLLAGPRGIHRQVGGGRFDAVADGDVARAQLSRLSKGNGVVAASGAQSLALSTDRGATWRALKLPNPTHAKRNPERLRDATFLDARHGVLLDLAGRVWSTVNGGRTWAELAATGTSRGLSMSFSSPSVGFLAISGYAVYPNSAFVLRTTDAGRTWRPQQLSIGTVVEGGVLATSPTAGYALTAAGAPGGQTVRGLFGTATGGDAGNATQLRLTTKTRRLTRRALRRASNRVVVTGTLAGAAGGEQVVVSMRSAKGTRWSSQVVTVGANGGSFTATFRVTGSSYFVAQWPGDSGRAAAGTPVLGVAVH